MAAEDSQTELQPRTRAYLIDSLTWNPSHCRNQENKYCYCGESFDADTVNLYCEKCKTWYHRKCLKNGLVTNQWLAAQGNYVFCCAVCQPQESFEIVDSSFRAAGLTTLVNLYLNNPNQSSFSAPEIIEFMERNWDVLLPARSKVKSWETNALTGMQRSDDVADFPGPASKGTYRFKKPVDLTEWTPARMRPRTANTNKLKRRTAPQGGEPAARKKKEIIEPPHCFLREKYRYTAAELDPFHPSPPKWRVTSFDIPVTLSSRDKAPQLQLSKDGLTVSGHKGYCSVRCTHGVGHGSWFWEATIMPTAKASATYPDGHVRLGWGSAYCDLQVPCGFDSLSHAWRDINGTAFHKSKGRTFGPADGYGPGDVLGFLIELPALASSETMPPSAADFVAVDLSAKAYLEEPRLTTSQKLPRSIASKMTCFKNGQCVGVLADALPTCRWYPTLSLYYGSQVQTNFGPEFKHPPSAPFRPMSEANASFNAEIAMVDILDKVVAKVDAAE
eukprot:TRINITY_DN8142_c0_g1_i2.p1 TRINITY_DN8142_c0_g1~~TRINITY_DN8142_c0_g1_i2.p1  ORF type:complete len:502 (+),score=41.25 TRINITY_DN8142_c0_g1_i2:51-1556(+)